MHPLFYSETGEHSGGSMWTSNEEFQPVSLPGSWETIIFTGCVGVSWVGVELKPISSHIWNPNNIWIEIQIDIIVN